MAMYYTKMAVDAGCIGFLSSNASPSMALWGGVDRLVGNIRGHGQYLLEGLRVLRWILQIQLLQEESCITHKLLLNQSNRWNCWSDYRWQAIRDMPFQWQWMYYRVFCPPVSLEDL